MSTNEIYSLIDSSADDNRYIIFRAGTGIYGVPLLSVREIIESQSVKPIPNSVDYFCGVINIRGEIVGVIDVRNAFDLPESTSQSRVLMVFSTIEGTLAAVVNNIEAVVTIHDEEIDSQTSVATPISDKHLIGVTEVNNNSVFLFNLADMLADLRICLE